MHLLFFSLFIKSWKYWLPMSTVHSVCRTIGPPSTLEKIIRKKRAENKWQICEWWDNDGKYALPSEQKRNAILIGFMVLHLFSPFISFHLSSLQVSPSIIFSPLFSSFLSFLLLSSPFSSSPLVSSLLLSSLILYYPVYQLLTSLNSWLPVSCRLCFY